MAKSQSQNQQPPPATKRDVMLIVNSYELKVAQKNFTLKMPEGMKVLSAVKKDWGAFLYVESEHGAAEREYNIKVVEESGAVDGRYLYLTSYQENIGRTDKKCSVYHVYVEK